MNQKAGLLGLITCSISVAVSAFALLSDKELSWDFAVENPPPLGGAPFFETVLDYKSDPESAHSPSIGIIGNKAQIMWFEGTRESHEDVVIKKVDLTPVGGEPRWQAGEVTTFLNRNDLAKKTHPRQEIWSLGNVIQSSLGEQSVFLTVVSVGGWAAASIAQVDFESNEIAKVRKLRLSPMLNRSHLVRNSTIRYADNSVAIPAYFEMGNAFGELVRVDDQGKVVDKRRVTQGRFAIQPEIVVLDSKRAVALSRNFDKKTDRLIASWTDDGGQNWSPPELLELPNPNSPVTAIRLRDGRILMAFNDDPIRNGTLSLAISSDGGREWKRIAELENGSENVRYPDFSWLPDGSLLLVYSFGSKKGIRAHRFNTAWVDAQ